MKKVAYVQPIFAPDKLRFERNIASIKSMGEYLRKYPYKDIELHFGGWADDDFWPTFKEFIKEEFKDFTFIIKKFDRNYGKAFVVNKLMKEVETEYVLTADSDILFLEEEKNMFERLVFAAEKVPEVRGKPMGLIALNQKGQNCHLDFCYKHKVEFNGENGRYEALCFPKGKGGIAGGCIFFRNDVWKKIGGYREMGIYSGEDAYFLVDLFDAGYCLQIFETLHVRHPAENDPIYAKWKVKVCQRDSGHGRKITKSQMIEADSFWEKHGKK